MFLKNLKLFCLLGTLSLIFTNCYLDTDTGTMDSFSTSNDQENHPDNSNAFDNIENNCQGEHRVPNHLSVVQELAREYPETYQATWDQQQQRFTNDLRFLDLVIEALHAIDTRFGYNCVRGDCNRLSADALAYYRGCGNAENNTDVDIIDFLAGRSDGGTPTPAWTDVTQETADNNTIGRWRYPRPGSENPSNTGTENTSTENTGNTNSRFNPSTFSWNNVIFLKGGGITNQNISRWNEVSTITNFYFKGQRGQGVCIDHTKKNDWTDFIPSVTTGEIIPHHGNPWIFIPDTDGSGKVYARTYEHLRKGQVCKLGHGDKYDLKTIFTEILPLSTSKAKEGLPEHMKTWVAQPGNIIGFAVSAHARYQYVGTQERSDIVWVRVPDYNATDSGGEIVGRTSGSTTTTTGSTTTTTGDHQVGQCSPTPNTCLSGVYHPHPKDTLTEYHWTCRNIPHSTGKTPCHTPRTAENCGPNPHYKTVNGRCLPSCGALANAHNIGLQDHQLQPAPQCSAGWTRLGDSYEEAQHGTSICCKKISSSP